MPAPGRSPRRLLASLSGLAVTAAGLSLVALPAHAVSSGLVISEVYGGGGNAGATYRSDFIELHNPTGSAISVDGWSVQYRASGNSAAASGVTPLTGTVPAGGYYLVQQASGTGGTVDLPTPNATGGIAMSGSAFTVWLSDGTTPLNPPVGSATSVSGVVDLVGVNSNTFETTKTGGTANATSASRTAPDGDVNAAEFTIGTPNPQSTATTPEEPEEPEEPTAPQAATIAEVQGTGAVSPLAGSTVVTTGVVTAAWPTGGLSGFYLQTPGDPATPAASDAVFVYTPGLAADGYPAVGESVEVTGAVTEFNGLTEITADAAGLREVADLGTVVPLPAVPGTDCALPGTDCPTGAELDALREAHEGEAVLPTGPITVTDTYDGSAYNGGSASSGFFGEIGLAVDDQPLVTPTEVVDAQDTAGVAARAAYNNAHRVILDDGSSLNYASNANKGLPLPYYTAEHTVRVGAAVTFTEPVVLDYRFGWKLQPTEQVVGVPEGISFEQDRPALPEDVGGDVKLATFNVLNYFTTLGTDVAGCSSYNDRAGNPITVNSCSGNGPRGAWDAASFERQQAKIVDAITKLDADVVSLEEIENSLVVDGHDRDEAVAALVEALNADAGATRWDYVRSPAEVPADEDVIRTAFIYDPATVRPVGASQIFDDPAFANARQPFAQVFTGVDGDDSDGFAVVANHFKSKGSGTPDPFGQGNANDSRVAQAQALVGFADTFAAARGVEKIFLAGDFNAYSEEDPVQLIEAAGYTSLESTSDPDEESYNFDGAVGSLDHVFANAAARGVVTGVDVWNINAEESVYYEYSRFNSNVTDLYTVDPFRSSDHNPEIVGIDLPDAGAKLVSKVKAKHAPNQVYVGEADTTLDVEVRTNGHRATPTGTVQVLLEGRVLATGRLVDGEVTLTLPAFTEVGRAVLDVVYSGSSTVAGDSVEHGINVKKLKKK
ncbi:ExeM/NucH family extracellular endonuclease [Nocardioides abyssi]|uniref:ExeM/NucH family extracellular endonuclease n=1 Tax=Nocardioides abyssi TaxID=3058370 RepID=A0ABT8EU52_9ACTN|nr:ExeM/NucH family extracellular endonuclease [Nocardioides abyssi]MDN4161678.1 ExeM/NucH family extracellular endonuclease [Nocardioides abyssi]